MSRLLLPTEIPAQTIPTHAEPGPRKAGPGQAELLVGGEVHRCGGGNTGRVSLYRTWRPRTFAELVGQDAVVRTLVTAIETGRLAHAYLFSGPRGSGKTSAAKILARCINCVTGPTATPDNTCDFCRAILEGTALDVLEIDAASNRGIDEIRALREAVKFAPSTMRRKVYIVDEAHMLTREGANAFLKTLEEPPEHAVFILCTTAPEALPPTILSRCQRYAFRRIAIPTMIARMRVIADAEGIAIDDAALSAIAYRADGGLRDALTMLEQATAFGGGRVDLVAIEAAFGATGRATAQELVGALLDEDAVGALRIVERASDEGLEMQTLLRGIINELRHLLVGRIEPVLLEHDLSPEDVSRTVERAQATSQARIVRGLRLMMDALAAARLSGNARLELETALLRYVLQGEDPTLDALAARVAALEDGSRPAAPATSPPPAAPKQPRVAETKLTLGRLEHHWPAVIERVRERKPSVAGHLARARLVDFDGATLTIAVPDEITHGMLRDTLAIIGQTLADTTGQGLAIKTIISPPGEDDETDEADAADLLGYAVKKLS